MSLTKIFEAYSTFGVTGGGGGKGMTTKNLSKWFKEAGVFNSKEVGGITSNDTDITYNKIMGKKAAGQKKFNASDLEPFLDQLATDVSSRSKGKVSKEQVKSFLTKKLGGVSGPGLSGTTKTAANEGVKTLTDASQYTGAHKARFSADGHGMGKAGREDVPDTSGYVGGYKEKGTYDKTH